MSHVTIERFMTRSPHTIGEDQTLTTARRLMNTYGVRHLPVLRSGQLVGVLSQRDLHFIETLADVDPDEVLVSEAMSSDAYTVAPHASVNEVARAMAEHKYGSAVVVSGGRVIGVFTTIDALRALCELAT